MMIKKGKMMRAHEVDYKLFGDDLQFVEIELDPRESVIAEAGAMMYMDAAIVMDTIFGDGVERNDGLMGKLMGAGKRMITGESLFMTQFTNRGSDKQRVAFAAPYPGKIIPVDLTAFNGRLVCQKDAFLCSAKGIAIDIAFQKRIGVGFFGGEGFIMEKLEGDGLAFLNAGGTIIQRELAAGEVIKIDTGCLVALTDRVDYDIEMVKGIKSAVFGGEGLFLATLKGPGHVWLQSLPFSRMADRILSSARAHGGKSTGEGSALDLLGGLGNLLDGK
jgi:uncharacterized protein (TIGR00266 family)